MRKKILQLMTRLHMLDPRLKFFLGLLFVLLGLLALVTPLTPGSWLVFVGLELLGVRILTWRWFAKWLHTDERLQDTDRDQKGL